MAGLEDTWPRTAFSGKCVSLKGHACRIFKPFKRVVHSVSIKKIRFNIISASAL